MKQTYEFLQQLALNNNREWFNANKPLYKELQERFNTFAQQLIDAVSAWDEEIAASNLSVKDCTYRIYRDTRFTKNKEPYKTHMGIFICRGGKKAPYAGYYFHLEPELLLPDRAPLSMGKCFLISGTYHFESKVLRSIRDEISINGDSFLDAIAQASTHEFGLYEGEMLRKVPAEFAFAPDKWHHLLKQKEYALSKEIDPKYLLSKDLVQKVSEDFKSTADFIHKINMAVDYALENM
ncbi:MAG: DUF2461 domain-containing protein [Bacteroidales bacterium]|nr:DUF2461 domain-containing protein [Bacteroidales bacterium]